MDVIGLMQKYHTENEKYIFSYEIHSKILAGGGGENILSQIYVFSFLMLDDTRT